MLDRNTVLIVVDARVARAGRDERSRRVVLAWKNRLHLDLVSRVHPAIQQRVRGRAAGQALRSLETRRLCAVASRFVAVRTDCASEC